MSLSNILADEKYVDMVITGDGWSIPAHICVLAPQCIAIEAMYSLYRQNCFCGRLGSKAKDAAEGAAKGTDAAKDPSKYLITWKTDADGEIVKLVVDMLYCRTINPFNDVDKWILFIQYAHGLGITDIDRFPNLSLGEKISAEDLPKIFDAIIYFECPKLISKITPVFGVNEMQRIFDNNWFGERSVKEIAMIGTFKPVDIQLPIRLDIKILVNRLRIFLAYGVLSRKDSADAEELFTKLDYHLLPDWMVQRLKTMSNLGNAAKHAIRT